MKSQDKNAPKSALAGVLQDNIRSVAGLRDQISRSGPLSDRVAARITRVTGSLTFVVTQAVVVVLWILVNTGVLGITPFDPFPFVILALSASLEAIFLSAFVLMAQNHMARVFDRRAELDLQINMFAEHEITRLIHLSDAIARHLGVPMPEGAGVVDELKENVTPGQVMDEIAKAEQEIERPDE